MQWLIDILFGMVANYLQGMIVMWSGLIATIPDGWVLCDGNNGTPDLRDKFIVCAQGDLEGHAQTAITEPPSFEGGEILHSHWFVGDGHAHPSKGSHRVSTGTDHYVWDYQGDNWYTDAAVVTGQCEDQADIVVPYFCLAFIMKT